MHMDIFPPTNDQSFLAKKVGYRSQEFPNAHFWPKFASNSREFTRQKDFFSVAQIPTVQK